MNSRRRKRRNAAKNGVPPVSAKNRAPEFSEQANCLICSLAGRSNYSTEKPDACLHENAATREIHVSLMSAGGRFADGMENAMNRMSVLMSPPQSARDAACHRRSMLVGS